VQVVAAVQDTPARLLNDAPTGIGMGWTVHVVPFQPSASGVRAELEITAPTASHAVAAPQDTPLTDALVTPAGRGIVTSDQVVPFQVSANGAVVNVVDDVTDTPTATQLVDEVHETPASRLLVLPLGLGVV
jgi:hypothetical protein